MEVLLQRPRCALSLPIRAPSPIHPFSQQVLSMRINRFALLPLLIVLAAARLTMAQVVSPVEIRDPDIRALQQRSMNELNQISQSIASSRFNFPFYFSRKLDIDEKQQKRTDQHSIRFERYNGSTVIAISGNYYGAYASDKFTNEERAKETLL